MSSKTKRKQEEEEVLPPAGLEALAVSSEDAKVKGKTSNTGDDHEEKTHNDGDDNDDDDAFQEQLIDNLFGPIISAEGTDDDEDSDDEDLFKPAPKEECPLCLTRLPISDNGITYESCCGKRICDGCDWKHRQVLRKMNAERALDDPPKPPLQLSCAFCRKPTPTSDEELIKRVENRMAHGDPEAFDSMGGFRRFGKCGLARDVRRAFELCLRGAELGSGKACFNISCMYRNGIGVERDASKEERYLKLAAKKGHTSARHNLGCLEWLRGNYDVAVKHFMISATAGHDNSTKNIGTAYRKKYATKDQYEMAIRLNKDAKDEMSSEERDKAKAARASGRRF